MQTFKHALASSLRVAAATLLICVGGYTSLVLGVAQGLAAPTASGSLIRRDGAVVGSRLIAQGFTRPEYVWPRPSAADYDGQGAGGSNASPAGPELRARGVEQVARYGATEARPLPPELAAASGGGLDPHITVRAARYQAARVSVARGVEEADVVATIDALAFAPGGPLTEDRLVNVLELNLALDERFGSRGGEVSDE
ncbi:MAG: potassium-transporting ATPase subunit C [Sandaracinaceae bacterium]|nr:potassium-transporting ATPase subunit C [Sandaracinaceae bacterium]